MNTDRVRDLSLWLQRRDLENELVRAALVEMQEIIAESGAKQTRIVELIRQVDALTLAEAKRKARKPKTRPGAQQP